MSDYTRQQHQARLIIDRFRAKNGGGKCEVETAPTEVKHGENTTDSAIQWPVSYMYARRRILVRHEHLERVRSIVKAAGGWTATRPLSAPVIQGLHRMRLPKGVSVDRALKAVERRLGDGLAGPDHLISITGVTGPSNGTGGTCPATEPAPTDDQPFPPLVTDPTVGAGVRVVVVDTGIDTGAVGAHSWLAGVTGAEDKAIGDRNPLGPYAGHGTFIAGLIRAVAPAAEVHVRADFEVGGVIWESDLVRALSEVLAIDKPDIISLSAGVWSGETVGPLGFTVFHDTALCRHKGVLVVAAAGNDASRRPFWPAAAPWTLSVGALCHDGTKRTDFTNFGGWVDVYAQGQDLINAFPTGSYRYSEDGVGNVVEFTGLARWSGTSFSVPLAVGLIAARMSNTGENGIDAASALLGIARANALSGNCAVMSTS